MDLQTCDDPPSYVSKRKAIVRLDRPPGHEGRVLGVVHRGFQPLQNRDGAILFDAIFGKGEPVYHTGGYLGSGEVVWLLAKIDKPLMIGKEDLVEPYALFANSHDGSIGITISLTTVRVVCQNTLQIALEERNMGEKFRRAHQGTFREHVEAAREFWGPVMGQLDQVTSDFTRLTKARCSDGRFMEIIERLLPMPSRPRNIENNPRLRKAHEAKVTDIRTMRERISRLRWEGKGAEMDGAKGTLWGVLNAVTEYVDHHREIDGSRVAYALLGDGMGLKLRAYRLIQEVAQKAA